MTERLHFHFSLSRIGEGKWQPTPLFLPGESQGRGSLMGCHLWGRTESDMTEATWQQQQQPHLWKCHLFWIICSCWVGPKMNLVRYYDPGLAIGIYGWSLPLEENRNQAEFSKPCSETQRLGCGKWESSLEAAGNISDVDSSGTASAVSWCLGSLRRLRHLARFMSSLHFCF